MNVQPEKKTPSPTPGKWNAFLKGLTKLLRHNLGWKIAALLLAILMWAGLISQDATLIREKTFVDVPVSITGADTLQRYGYIVTTDLSDRPISVRMKADVPQLVYNTVTASVYNPRIDLSRLRSTGKQTVKITTSSSSTYGMVTELIPSTVELEIEEYLTRYRIPVSILRSGEVPEGFYLDNLTLDPPYIAISGPQSQVNKVRRAVVNLDLSALPAREGTASAALPLVLLDDKERVVSQENLQITSESVILDSAIVAYKMYPTQMITLSGVGLTTGKPLEGYEVKQITVTPSTIRMAAETQALEAMSLDALFLNDAVKLDDRSESFTQTVWVRRPSEVVNLTPSEVTVAVEIGPIIEEKEFENLKISLQNVPEGMKAEMESQRADVTLSGPMLWMDKVRSSHLTLKADLSGLGEGEHEVPVECLIKDAEGVSYVYRVDPETIKVSLTAK